MARASRRSKACASARSALRDVLARRDRSSDRAASTVDRHGIERRGVDRDAFFDRFKIVLEMRRDRFAVQ
jgi:hypothetical protein